MFFRNIVMAFFLVCSSLPASAQQLYHSDGSFAHHGFGMPMWGMASDREIDRSLATLQQTLGLSAGQVANIRNLAQSRRETFRSIRENARPKYEELRILLGQPAPDPKQVGTIVLELDKIREQARSAQADLNAQLMTLLNPNQQQIVNTLRDQAQTFDALRRLGLLGVPGMRRGMPLSMLSRPGEEP